LKPEPILVEPIQGDRLAKREFQDPALLRHGGKRPYWYIRYRIRVIDDEGKIVRKEVWHPLGNCDEATKREALRQRARVLEEVNHQVYTVRDHIPLADFARIYETQHLPTLAPGGREQQHCLLKNHVTPALGAKRLCDIGTLEVQAFLNAKAAEGLSWWTRRAMKAVLSSMFTKAVDWNYWDRRNPVTRVRIGKKRVKYEKRIPTDEQLRLLLDRLPGRVRWIVETAVSTGMRISEILGLKWRSVDLDRGVVHVEERYYRGDTGEPKSERAQRSLPLGELVAAYCALKPAGASAEDYVFHERGKPLDDRELLQKVLRPVAEELGIYFPGFGWHTFRRMHLTLVQEAGATTFEAMAQAGHSRPSMTREYTIIGLDRRERAVRRMQRRLFVVGKEPDRIAG
jgi:integrase